MRAKILNASAGSGKTYQLAYKYVRDVVEQPSLYRHILAVTFTNKATEEMKSRILAEIHRLASGAPSSYTGPLCRELSLDERTVRTRAAEVRTHILHDYSHFTVLTIDTFFQRILRAFIKELGIDLNYNVEIETSSILTKSADTLIERITSDKELERWLTAFVEERIEEGRSWDVREGILSLGNELFKERNKQALAMARSKEDLGRIVGGAAARARASKEKFCGTADRAAQIIRSAGLTPADFSGKSRSFAHYFLRSAQGETGEPTATVRRMASSTTGWCAKGSAAEVLVGQLQPLLKEMCDQYDAGISLWNTADLLRENYRSFALLSDLYARVQELCESENTMLLSETKYLLSAFIEHNDAPFIYEKVGNRFERFMIDEFQDTSLREWENFLPLLRNAMSQSEAASVLLVGDVKQSIYRWRGGDWRILRDGARRALGHDDTEIVDLQSNFRSLPAVVDFNNRMIGSVVRLANTALNNRLAAAEASGAIPHELSEELRNTLANAYAGHEQTPRKESHTCGHVGIATYEGEPPLIDTIKSILDKGFKPKQILILVRGATDGAKAAATLLGFKRTNQDPRYRFDVMTQEALNVGYAPITSFVTATLYLSVDPGDSIRRAIYNRYLGREPFDAPLTEEEVLFLRSVRLLSPEEAFEKIVMHHALQHRSGEVAYLQALHELIISFSAGRIADIPLFLNWWEEQGSKRSLVVEQSETTIEITTIHKAKGLEKPVVVIPYCNWSLAPKTGGHVSNIVWAEPQGDLSTVGCVPVRYKKEMGVSMFSADYYREEVYSYVDNINLLYVALTRAVESLHIFIPRRQPHIGELILQSLAPEGERVALGEMTGRYSRSGEEERFEFGTFDAPSTPDAGDNATEHLLLTTYPTSEAGLRLRLPSQRYFEQERQAELSPRNFGILMHRLFEDAITLDDIGRALEQMRLDSLLSPDESDTLREMVDKALSDPVTRSWFDTEWETVRNENEIVVPGDERIRRPDRVMIRGERAVVVDYKFGEKDAERYRRQIADYMTLLRKMGYSRVEGWLWYVKLGRTERIDD